MTNEQLILEDIKDIIEWADNIASQWNGDEAGIEEDRASLANDIIHKATELEDLIGQMEDI